MLRSQRAKKPNLALKAKVIVEVEEEEEDEESNPEDTKYDYHEHMALALRQFWSKNNQGPISTRATQVASRASNM